MNTPALVSRTLCTIRFLPFQGSRTTIKQYRNIPRPFRNKSDLIVLISSLVAPFCSQPPSIFPPSLSPPSESELSTTITNYGEPSSLILDVIEYLYSGSLWKPLDHISESFLRKLSTPLMIRVYHTGRDRPHPVATPVTPDVSALKQLATDLKTRFPEHFEMFGDYLSWALYLHDKHQSDIEDAIDAGPPHFLQSRLKTARLVRPHPDPEDSDASGLYLHAAKRLKSNLETSFKRCLRQLDEFINLAESINRDPIAQLAPGIRRRQTNLVLGTNIPDFDHLDSDDDDDS